MTCKRVSALSLFLLLATSVAMALPSPDQDIRAATEQVQAAIREHRAEYQADSAKLYAMVDQIVVPHFDTRAIGQLVLGRHWKDATPQQRDRFVKGFKNNLIHSYADALLRYADSVKADWKPVHAAAGATDVTVNADLVRAQGPPITIGFSVHASGDAWKVYDVVVDGISLGTTFRAQFNEEIGKKGLDGLIARLESGAPPLPDKSPEQKPRG